jgi:23S rRNA (uracil1939-C5)-methyltransferase
MNSAELRVDRVVYGGYGLARPDAGQAVSLIPFSLQGELVEVAPSATKDELQLVRVIEPSAERVEPGCPHFGVCGGCHLQMASYAEQLRIKAGVLLESLARAGVKDVPEIATHAAEPWHYRNRIRLHVTNENGSVRLGYRKRASTEILPIRTCPISAPLLWQTAEALLQFAKGNPAMRRWIESSREVEFFCDGDMSRLQITLFISSGEQPALPSADSFLTSFAALQKDVPELAGAGALRVHPRTGQVQSEIASWGAAGISYEVVGECYWVARGGFFQVNRSLLPTMVELVCANRKGQIAWDLFAGVGLFARILARSFERVTAVEANPAAGGELAAALQRIGPQHRAVTAVIVNFLRNAAVQRERPDLVVLDPPRAGAGAEVCDLLARVAPREVVYVSCDPVTLGRDLAILQAKYTIERLHLVDLFPQTYHQEAVVELRLRS